MSGTESLLAAIPDRCELEPIHTPGCIQPQGVLLCIDADNGTILAASANHTEIAGLENPLVGRLLREVRPELAGSGGDGGFMIGDALMVYRHTSGRTVFIEIEPCHEADRSSPMQFIDIENALNQLHDAETLEVVTQTAALIVFRSFHESLTR
ncbi:hypothetical protein CCP1ISM_4670001 [Azospirillaceae bacterium]